MSTGDASKPAFQLTRVDEGEELYQQTEIVMISDGAGGGAMSRRDFLGAGITAAAAVAFLSACGKEETTVRLAQADKRDVLGKKTALLRAHKESVNSIFISADGKWLASGSKDKTVKLWKLPERILEKTLDGHKNSIRSVLITPGKGEALISGGLDKQIKIWNLPGGEQAASLDDHKGGIFALCMSPDGTILASGSSDNTIKLRTEAGTKTLKGHQDSVLSLCISADGKWLASGSQDKTVKLWSLPGGSLINTFTGHHGRVASVCISPDGKLLVAGDSDGCLRLWSLPDGGTVKLLRVKNHIGSFVSTCISPDGQWLASGDAVSNIRLWSLPDGTLMKTLLGHTGSVNCLGISPDGKLLASGGSDSTIRLWSFPGGELVSALPDMEDLINRPESVKGAVFAMTSETGQVITYTLPCGAAIPAGATCACNCVSGLRKPATQRASSGTRPSGGGCRHGGGGSYQRCVCMAVRCRRT
ncbi:WD40 repeat protein [Ereboglobus sp. PH5-5]|uniref:WD40 repeat domain-containing protein n=1 Tax=Ereboglobus sp. PH5-5 TaxID=2940529 RepID=UPI0024071ECD|nr:WD40 repeat domain-containing protein [Ereboglobus sp. PH5-5]MDF9833831.1 WD40 repeat protein [Ereboglobus sp. PH5-5]